MYPLNGHCAPCCIALEAGKMMMHEGAAESNDSLEMQLCWLHFKRQVEEWVKEQEPERTLLNETAYTQKKDESLHDQSKHKGKKKEKNKYMAYKRIKIKK